MNLAAVLTTLLLAAAEPPRVAEARKVSAAAIAALFEHKTYPPRRIVLRAFKQDRELELWAGGDTLEHIKTYRICASSGTLGEKTRAGDGQVPEGFYEIAALNPYSQFLLSMRVSYPNARDRLLHHGGGDIFIHGSCVTIGCIPLEDGPIQELFSIANDSRTAGGRLDVQIFPGRDWDALLARAEGNAELERFWRNLREGDELFRKTLQPLRVSVDARGRYLFGGAVH